MKTKAVIFGTGDIFTKAMDLLTDFEIVAVVDNSTKKQGSSVIINNDTYIVENPEILHGRDYDAVIVTISFFKFKNEVLRQLFAMNLKKEILLWEEDHLRLMPKVQKTAYKIEGPHIYVDISGEKYGEKKAGIYRVTDNLLDHLRCIDNDVFPVRYLGEYITNREHISQCNNKDFDGIEYELKYTNRDVFFFPVPYMSVNEKIIKILNKDNAKNYSIIYDILPLEMDVEYWGEKFVKKFTEWILTVLNFSSGILCISETVAKNIANYYRLKRDDIRRTNLLPVFVFDMGFNLPVATSGTRKEITDFVVRQKTFLMVGTIEPRKNHTAALKAFEAILENESKSDIGLLIIGMDGWNNQEFKDLYFNSKFSPEKILWIDDASDDELVWAYKNADCLLYPTYNEGFGLPMIEAAYWGLPVLCNDIPIFHEIAQNNVTYFNANDLAEFEKAVLTWCNEKNHPDSRKIKLHSWEESAEQVHNILTGKAKPYIVL